MVGQTGVVAGSAHEAPTVIPSGVLSRFVAIRAVPGIREEHQSKRAPRFGRRSLRGRSMGMLVTGEWLDDDEPLPSFADGAFVRPGSALRLVTADGSSAPAAPRYHNTIMSRVLGHTVRSCSAQGP